MGATCLGVEDLLAANVADALAMCALLAEFSTCSKLLAANRALLLHT